MSRELLKLALEAIERGVKDGYWNRDTVEVSSRIQEALAEQPAQQEPFDHVAAANSALNQAQNRSYQIASAAQQEPVGEIGKIVMFGGQIKEVAWKNGKIPPAGSVLYTSPPAQRKPLTDAQIEKCFAESDGTFVSAARAIEAAHGIKENT